ncbi:MAG: sugar phosphate isomerase/epimerase [Clostridia bacterium]|nr:sugar phosphate isomerase/epimerase [Clostridia bacterium]
MKLGISSGCWYPSFTEESAEKIKNAGYTAAEVFLSDDSENETEFLQHLKNRFDRNGIKAVSVHPYTSFAEQFLFFSDYSRRKESAFKYYRKYHNACKILGAEFINFHGATIPVEVEKYAEIYQRLYREAKEEGLTFCQENVRKYTCGKVAYLAELKRTLNDEIAFTLDVKQAHMEGESISDMIKIMDKNIKLVHISDHTEEEPCLLPGFGSFDIENFLKSIKNVGYDGYLITEIYSKNCKAESHIKASNLLLTDLIKNFNNGGLQE